MKHHGLRAFILGAALTITGMAGAAPPKPAATQSVTMRALRGLEPGQWELRDRAEGGEARRICAADLKQLLQFRHASASCKRFVVTDTARELVVTYDCGASGNGRTALRPETSRLAQIQAQGIADGAPFETAVEARRVGSCR